MDGNCDDYEIVASDEDDEAAEISAKAAGLDQTIHLLEGVAAEGKIWFATG